MAKEINIDIISKDGLECREILKKKGAEAGLDLNDDQLNSFALYYDLLIEKNKVMNLTGLTSPVDVAVKHFIDSLSGFTYEEGKKVFSGKTLIDVGTGAGFPGIPLKIYYPDLKVVLLDSLAKRLRFLEEVIEALNLQDISVEHARAEEGGRNKKYREKYDIATARAVANLAVLGEYCLPFVKKGGLFLAFKGSKYKEEIMDADKALKILGGKINTVKEIKLPGLDDGRAIIFVNKIQKTPAVYPRKAGTPVRKPLGHQ